jgi:hypothetical protein
MRHLTLRQLLVAAVIGILFAALQGDLPLPGVATVGAHICAANERAG